MNLFSSCCSLSWLSRRRASTCFWWRASFSLSSSSSIYKSMCKTIILTLIGEKTNTFQTYFNAIWTLVFHSPTITLVRWSTLRLSMSRFFCDSSIFSFWRLWSSSFLSRSCFVTFPAPSLSSEDDMSSVGTVVSRLMSSDSMELEMFAVASFGFLGGISTQLQSNRPTD